MILTARACGQTRAGAAEHVLLLLVAVRLSWKLPLSEKSDHQIRKAVRPHQVQVQVLWEAKGRWVLVWTQARLRQLQPLRLQRPQPLQLAEWQGLAEGGLQGW